MTWAAFILASGIAAGASFYDDFERADGPIDGSRAPSGQTYEVDRKGQSIRGGRYVSDVDGGAKIAYIHLADRPSSISAEFVFAGGVEHHENAVIGSAEKGFGLGSVQLAVWRNQWHLFVVTNPIVDPYPLIAAGSFKPALPIDITQRMSVHFASDRASVTVDLPDGTSRTVSHPILDQYWGSTIGLQVRRPNAASGTIEFLSWSAD